MYTVHKSRSLSITAAWAAVFVTCFALYASTANRGAQWQDSGEFILRVMTLDVIGRLGLALSHPLHHWLGRLMVSFGLVEPSFAVTLVSSLAGAIAVANVFGCVRSLTNKTAPALLAAASLMLANTFWHLSTITEVYTLGAALLSAECWCLIAFIRNPSKPALWGMCLFSGLGFANHLQALLTLPVIVCVIFIIMYKGRVRAADVLIGAAIWMIGSLPYTCLIIMELQRSGDLVGTIKSAMFGASFSSNVLNARVSAHTLAVSVGFPILNFPNLLLPLAFYGICRSRAISVPPMISRALLAGLLIHAVFAFRYNVVDQQTFFLPIYVLLAIFGGLGASLTLDWRSSAARRGAWAVMIVLLATTPLIYLAAISVARQADVLAGFPDKPYRDKYAYLLAPWSVYETSAQQMSSQAVKLAGPDGLIACEDSMASFALKYQALRTGNNKLTILKLATTRQQSETQTLEQAAADNRTIVLVPIDRNNPKTEPPKGKWQRQGDIYILDKP